MAVGAEMVHKPCSAKEVAAVIIEAGEHLEFEQVADITGDSDCPGGSLSIKSQTLEHNPVIERALDSKDLARGRPGCPESCQVRFPFGTDQAGEACFGGSGCLRDTIGAGRGGRCPSTQYGGGKHSQRGSSEGCHQENPKLAAHRVPSGCAADEGLAITRTAAILRW